MSSRELGEWIAFYRIREAEAEAEAKRQQGGGQPLLRGLG